MSADGDIAACPGASTVVSDHRRVSAPQTDSEKNVEKTKKMRKVSFPDEEALVTQYFEPANPWQDVPTTTRSQLAAEYLEACRIHNTPPIDAVLQQIRDLPENSIGGSTRAPRLVLTECALLGNAPADALEALLSKVQFRRVEIDSVEMDDEGAEAIFDMLEYYESAAAVCISGPRQFGIRGWQAASRMIKKSAELLELEISESPLEAGHASVLARSLRPLACRLRSLCLQRAQLTGEPLLNLVIALKSNSSVRELRLGDNTLTANDASQLGSLLRYNTRIQLLDLSNNQIQDAGVDLLADALVNQASQTPPSAAASPLSPHHVPLTGYETRGLAFLVLWNNQLTWNCAQSLAKVLRSSQSLCVLNIGRNCLGAEAVRALVCGGGPVGGALVSLGLQAARLGHDAARLLADLVRADTRLQRLDLRDNKLGVEGLQAICVAMKENTTLTQIDLDEPTDSATSLSAQARLTREIRALCRRNEGGAAAPARLLRKISLTCHTATLPKSGPSAEEERRTRLRSPAPSPAPSPAGSPVPAPHSPSPHAPSPHPHSRFYVTRVTPERDSSTDSSCSSPSTPTRPACSPSPSRFKVVQVAEPPKIQVYPASQPRKASSRFSVTRNYDSMYNPTVTPVTPRPDSAMSDPGVTSVTSVKGDDTLASTPDSVKSDSEIGITRFATQLVVGSTPINVARFIVSKPDYDPLKSKGDKQTEEVKKEKVEVEKLADVTEKLTNVTEKLSDVPNTIGNVTEKLTNVTEKLIDVSEKLSNVPHNVANVLEKVTNAPDDKTHVPEDIVSTTTHSKNVPDSLINASHELSHLPVSENLTDLSTISGNEPQKVNNSRFTICKPDFNSVMEIVEGTKSLPADLSTISSNAPQKVNNSRFTICKPDFNSVIESVEGIKTLPENVDKVSCKENIGLVLEVKYKDGTECIKVDTLPDDKIKSKEDEAVKGDSIRNREKNNALVLKVKYKETDDKIKSKDDEAVKDSMRNSEKMSTLDSNKTQSNETMIVGNAHRLFHIQPVTSPPRIDTDSIGSRIKNVTVDDVMKVEAPSIKSDIATLDSKTFDSETITNPDCKKLEAENTAICLKDPINKDITLKKDVGIEESSNIDKNMKSKKVKKEISKDGVSTSLETKNIEEDAAISLKDSIEKDTELIKDKDDTKKLEVIREVIIPLEEESSEKFIIVGEKDVKDKKLEITEFPVPVIIMKEDDVKTNTKINIETDNKFTPVASNIESVIVTHRDEVKSDKTTSIDDKRKATDVSSTQIVSDVKKSDSLVSKDKSTANIETDAEAKGDNKCDICDAKTVHSVTDEVLSDIVISETDTEKTVELDRVKSSVPKSDDHTVCDKDSDYYKDKMEELSHNETVVSVGDDKVLKTETKLIKSSVGVSETERVDVNVAVTVNKESLCNNAAKVRSDQIVDSVNKNSEVKIDDRVRSSVGNVRVDEIGKKDGAVIKQIEAITEDLGNIIQEMQDLPCKAKSLKNDSTQTDDCITYKVPGSVKESVLKKNRSESSLDSPDLEVSRLMKRKPDSAFCDSSSSLEISGSSMESLNEIRKPIPEVVETERRRESYIASAESSIESSDVTPVNLLNLSVSSNESVSPIIFGGKKLHGSLSSLEASVSSLESRHEKMVTSADSGIEYSLQNPTENKDDTSSNEGTLTHNSSLKEGVKKEGHETLTSPKRTSSLLDVPAVKTKGLDRMRKISWVAPSASFHVPKPEPDRVEIKLQSNLEKLLSLFQHPSSLFSRSQSDEEKKSASNTPPRKDSSLTSSFWTWGSGTDKSEKDDKEDRDSLSEATDSTLSCERVQVSYVDESFSKKLDSKTPSTDTDNTLSEFQSFQNEPERDRDTEGRETERERNDSVDKVTTTTDDNLVQKSLVLSVKSVTSEGNMPGACDNIDLIMPNDLNRNVYEAPACAKEVLGVKLEEKDPVRPRTFAAVLKSGADNLEKSSPEAQPVDKLPSKVIREIKENIGPENTIFTSLDANPIWETEPKADEAKAQSELAPIATIDETCDEAADSCIQLAFIDDVKIVDDERIVEPLYEKTDKSLETVDLGKDALSYLMYENQDFEPETEHMISNVKSQESLAQELKDAENKELLDLSPELILDDALEMPVFTMDLKGMITSIPERAKKKSNSLEDLSQREEEKDSPKTKTIAFKVPESTSPRDIPERRTKLRSRSGSSPKSLPESLNKPSPISKMDTILSKKKKKVSSLGKMARDSLLALNMSDEEIAEFRRSYKLTSVESLKSLESVSEDANSQSGTSYDSRCRACLRLSQESLMSLDSITEDCRCLEDCEKRAGQSNR